MKYNIIKYNQYNNTHTGSYKDIQTYTCKNMQMPV